MHLLQFLSIIKHLESYQQSTPKRLALYDCTIDSKSATYLQDMVGKRDDEILPVSIPGVQEGMAIKQRALETGTTASGEITLVLPDACTHWMLTCEPRRSETKEVVGVAVAAVNITETVSYQLHKLSTILHEVHFSSRMRQRLHDMLCV